VRQRGRERKRERVGKEGSWRGGEKEGGRKGRGEEQVAVCPLWLFYRSLNAV